MKQAFTLIELLVVITIIGILASIGLNSFTSAQIKSRDVKRKTNLKQISDSLEAYYNDHGQYPAEADIVWGASLTDANGTIYMVQLPADPTLGLSYNYAYLDSGKKYQLYAHLENDQDLNLITITGPQCGTKVCNYGISSSNITPTEGRL